MRNRSHIYEITIELEDFSESDGEDIEEVVEDLLLSGLPDSLTAHIISFEEVDPYDVLS